MGATASKPVRTAPARYVAKQLPRPQGDVLEEFRKAQHTLVGINKTKEHVTTQPEPYIETKISGETTQQTDLIAPRWYINAWMEMVDNAREDRTVITGNLPVSWDRDKYEPYDLVRNRIDDEDLDWLLSPEARALPMDQLVGQTKLERQVLEDILATVEAPRRQYRNYKGKLHKAIEDPNTFLKDRKEKMAASREDELLREIGYSDEELASDRQYRTQRSRGVKTLDQLGVSLREKKRADRVTQHGEMNDMLEQRRQDMIEAGTYQPTEDELDRDPEQISFVGEGSYKAKYNKTKEMYKYDQGRNRVALSKMHWWVNRRREIQPNADKIGNVPTYNEKLTMQADQMQQQLEDAAAYSRSLHQAQGGKRWADPRAEFDSVMQAVRDYQEESEAAAKTAEANQPLAGPAPRKAPLQPLRRDVLPDMPVSPYDAVETSPENVWPKKAPASSVSAQPSAQDGGAAPVAPPRPLPPFETPPPSAPGTQGKDQ